MPLETIIVVAAVTAMFGTFAAALAWGATQTRDLPPPASESPAAQTVPAAETAADRPRALAA